MKQVEDILLKELPRNNSFFVFPSELVSSFWRRKSVVLFPKKAVLSDRFLSWDKFKEKTFSLNQEFSPVNKYIRTLFAASLLEENKQTGNLFQGIIHPEHSEGSMSFLSWLSSVLAEVKSFRENSELKEILLTDGVREDLDLLYKRYTNFLLKREMFEPSWVKAEIKDIGDEYFLFFPEAIEDYKEFLTDIEESSVIHTISINKKPLGGIEHFSSSTLELKCLLGRIGSLLDGGVRPQDIAITLPDMTGWRVVLEAEAGLRSIPLDFRLGQSLSEYPGGKLFRNILSCEKSGFSISSMKQILLDLSIPWGNKDIARALFNFGVKHHCIKNYRFHGKEIDVWKNALEKSNEPSLLLFYKTFKSGIEKIVKGKTFDEIKIAVQVFVSTFLETGLWPAGTLREFQFCLDTLNDLVTASGKVGILKYGSGCDIWLSAIDDRIYVKRSETTGINVFPYRVAAGASYLWHFIPGLSQDSSSVVNSKYLFLNDNQREGLTGLDTDFTESFINIYNFFGKNIVFSYSTDSFSGPALPPSLFVLSRVVADIQNSSALKDDEYHTELGYWNGTDLLPAKIFPIMKSGIDFALNSVFRRKVVDYTNTPITKDHLRKAIREKLINESGNLSISPSSLDQFVSCPFLFLFQRGLGVFEDDYKEIYIDHSIFGQVIHECFDRFFNYVDGSSSEFSKSLLEEYKAEISSIIDKVFNRHLALGTAFIPPVWNYCRKFTKEKLLNFIKIEAEQFPGYRLDSAEKRYSYLVEDRKIELNGRIDRVAFKGDKTAIIDYKKKNHLKKKDMEAGGRGPSTYQIPFYVYLVEKCGRKVSSASYYNVTDSKYDYVYNPEGKKSWCSNDDMAILMNKLIKNIGTMDDRIKEGNFSVHPEGCESCSFRRICRTKYHVR